MDEVDVVLEGSGIDEKFLGVTLFALVPNTTEFMNAMSFAMYGNIALRYVVLEYKSPAPFNLALAWRSVLRTLCRCACSKFRPWSPSRLGITLGKWVLLQTHSRRPFSSTSRDCNLRYALKSDFPAMGRDCDYPLDFLADVHVHRGEEQLSPWKYINLEVSWHSACTIVE